MLYREIPIFLLLVLISLLAKLEELMLLVTPGLMR